MKRRMRQKKKIRKKMYYASEREMTERIVANALKKNAIVCTASFSVVRSAIRGFDFDRLCLKERQSRNVLCFRFVGFFYCKCSLIVLPSFFGGFRGISRQFCVRSSPWRRVTWFLSPYLLNNTNTKIMQSTIASPVLAIYRLARKLVAARVQNNTRRTG